MDAPLDILMYIPQVNKERVYMKVSEFMQAIYLDTEANVRGTIDLRDNLLAVWVDTDVHIWDTTEGYIYVPKDRPLDLVKDTVSLWHNVHDGERFLEIVWEEV